MQENPSIEEQKLPVVWSEIGAAQSTINWQDEIYFFARKVPDDAPYAAADVGCLENINVLTLNIWTRSVGEMKANGRFLDAFNI